MDEIDRKLQAMHDRAAEQFRCPRCGGFIPNNQTPGAYIGALSRCTRGENDTPIYVCSACGTDEAMLQFTAGRCQTPDEWPVTRSFDMPEPDEMARMLNKLADG